MRPHIIYGRRSLNGQTYAVVLNIPRGLSSEGWDAVYEKFSSSIRVKNKGPSMDEFASASALYPDQCLGPVYWDEQLAGPGGSSFQLLPMEGATSAEIAACERKLRHERDVVRLSVVRVKKWLKPYIVEDE